MADGPVLTYEDGNRFVQLAFVSYLPADAYISEYGVVVNGDGLAASAPVITTGDGYGLPAFIRQLSDDFRGWSGTRSWRSLENQLRLKAAWLSGGHVRLRFEVTPSVYSRWSVTAEFELEAGEELRTLSDDLAAFLIER